MRHLLALALLAISLAGCWPDDSGSDYPGERSDPPDLTVRQSPNDTIRLGESVTFTAVFRDSLNPKWLYDWTFNVDGAVIVAAKERTARWTPAAAGNYRGNVHVGDDRASSGAYISYRTVVLP